MVAVGPVGCGDSDAEDGRPGSGHGGETGEGGNGTGGEEAVSPFGVELCNAAFCWEYPQPFGGTVNDMFSVGSTVWLAGEGVLARREAGAWTAAAAPGLKGVWASSNEDVWAVGEHGKIVHWDGLELVDAVSPTSQTLHGIWGAAPDDIWAVGDAGTIVHYDGASWQEVPGGVDELHAVWGSGPNDVYAVGGTLNVYTIAHYNGTSWTSNIGGLSGAGLYAIDGTGPDNVIAVGEYGHVYRLDPSGAASYLGSADSGQLRDVYVAAPEEIWVVSDGVLSVRSGSSWVPVGDVGGSTMLPDPEQPQLLLGGDGVVGFGPNSPTTQISAPNLDQLWVGPTGLGVAISSDGQVLTNDGGPWSAMSAIPAGSAYQFTATGLTDGTRLVIRQSDEDYSESDIYAVDGGSAAPLPAMEQQAGPLAGTSTSDIWSFYGDEYGHFNGSSWQFGVLPVTDASVSLAYAIGPADVWLVMDSYSSGAFSLHYTAGGWTSHPLGGPGHYFQGLARFNGKVYASGSFTDYTKPVEAGFVYYPIEPVLFEWSGDAWTKVAIPGVVPDYDGSGAAFVAASGSELFFATSASHPGLDNLLVFDGTTWTPRPYPATGANAMFATSDGTVRLLAGNFPFGVLRSR